MYVGLNAFPLLLAHNLELRRTIFPIFLTFEKFKYLPLPYCFVDFWCLTPESVIVPTSFGAVPFDRWPWHFVLSVERFGLPILEVYWLPNP